MAQYTMLKPLDYFASLVQQEEQIPLFEAALSIAQDDDPALDLNYCLLEIDKFAARLRRRLPADIAQIPKLRLLNNFFYQELGFAGNLNDYYNPDNSYLHKVLSHPARYSDFAGSHLHGDCEPDRTGCERHLFPRAFPDEAVSEKW